MLLISLSLSSILVMSIGGIIVGNTINFYTAPNGIKPPEDATDPDEVD